MNNRNITTKRIIPVTISAALLGLSAAAAMAQQTTPMTGPSPMTLSGAGPMEHGGGEGAQFLSDVATTNELEIDEGKLAMTHSQSPAVQQFATKMIADHTKLQAKTMQVATGMADKPTVKPTSDQQAELDQLSSLNGPAFDKVYIEDSVNGHKKAISEFNNAKDSVQNPKVTLFIDQTLPELQIHERMAEKMMGK